MFSAAATIATRSVGIRRGIIRCDGRKNQYLCGNFNVVPHQRTHQDVCFSTTSSKRPTKGNAKKRSGQAVAYPSINDKSHLTVAILGPPNAGKSTLFNRLLDKGANKAYRLNTETNARRIRKKAFSQARIGYNANNRRGGSMAIVSPTPGTTRDRRECIGRVGPTYFRLVDTAGVDGSLWQSDRLVVSPDDGDQKPYNREEDLKTVEQRMMSQSLMAAQGADLIFLMFDAKRGITNDVTEIVKWLRKLPAGDKTSENGNKTSKRGKNKGGHISSSLYTKTSGCVGANLEDLQREIVGIRKKEEDAAGEDDEEEKEKNDGPRKRIVAVLANKLEGDRWALDEFDQTTDESYAAVLDHLAEATRLGLGEPIPISAEHGDGMSDIAVIVEALTRRKGKLLSSMADADQADGEERESEGGSRNNDDDDAPKEKNLQLAILGRQNVGKSTLVNALLRDNRVITGATPGLTRDAIAVEWKWEDRPVKIVDTAGIRKKSQRASGDDIEDLAVQDAMRAMKTADVAVLVVDATAELLHRQELAIVDAVVREGRALVVAANKMDLLEITADYRPEHFARQVQAQIEARVPVLRSTPVIAMSSLTGDKVQRLMPVVFDARDRWSQMISTGLLNRWVQEVIEGQPPPMVNGRQVKIKYVMQTKGRPPTFLLFASTDKLPESYLRYLTRNFQDTFRMYGMEVRLAIKKSAPTNPYHNAEKSRRGGGSIGGKEVRKEKAWKQLRTIGRVDKSRRARKTGKW
jgi:GTP-binding protein